MANQSATQSTTKSYLTDEYLNYDQNAKENYNNNNPNATLGMNLNLGDTIDSLTSSLFSPTTSTLGTVNVPGVNNAIPQIQQAGPTIAAANAMSSGGFGNAYIDNLNAQTERYKQLIDATNEQKGSFMYKASPYLKGFANVAGGLGSIANIFAGFQQLDIMKDQLGIAKDQWKETKKELARVKSVRDRINSQYMS